MNTEQVARELISLAFRLYAGRPVNDFLDAVESVIGERMATSTPVATAIPEETTQDIQEWSQRFKADIRKWVTGPAKLSLPVRVFNMILWACSIETSISRYIDGKWTREPCPPYVKSDFSFRLNEHSPLLDFDAWCDLILTPEGKAKATYIRNFGNKSYEFLVEAILRSRGETG